MPEGYLVGKKKEFERDRDDLINTTSESGVRSFDSSSHQESDPINKKLPLKKSKSTDSLVAVTSNSGTNKVNELKRSNGTCDILSNSQEEDIKCTKSLPRFGQLTHTNNCVFSFNAKLHDGTIWSRALGRVAERPKSRNNESTSSCVIRVDSENSQREKNSITMNEIPTRTVDAEVDLQKWKSDKSTTAKTEYCRVSEKQPGNILNPDCKNKESNVKVSISSNTQTHQEWTKTLPGVSHAVSELPPNAGKAEESMIEVLGDTPTQLNSFSQMKMKENSDSSKLAGSSENIIDEQNTQVKMDVKTIKNEQGFDLLKYDMKSSGDNVNVHESILENYVHPTSSTGLVIDRISYQNKDNLLHLVDSSKVISENTTEFEVVNLAQVDLFREFKTTISKMRNVLNVLDVKQSLQGMIERSLSENKIKKSATEVLEAENISTQTAAMTFNQISTSTDGGCSNQTRNEGIMVQLSSETTSKRITLDSNLFKHIKPINKVKRRKKRSYRCKTNKVPTKVINNISSSQDGKMKTKMKPNKPNYHKCIIYHITQHKNAMDRCVGTPCPTMKEKLVLQNTFSALHFGPINEFPMLLNQHENENKRKKEIDLKLKSIISENNKSSHRRKSTPHLGNDTSKNTNQNGCHRSKTQPSLNYDTSGDYSSLSNSTTANWFVFKPSPPLVVKGRQSSSNDMVFDKNRSSTQELVSNVLEEEFKTSGLKGRISSSTMNMIKDQFCDKLNGINTKAVPDVMITVCVPLKSIVSKIKTSRKTGFGDNPLPSTESVNSNGKSLLSSSYDKSIQVNVSKNYINDNLQIIPEKMSRKSSEIYQHNKIMRENMSSKRLSTFKKIFGNKATSCSNINPFGHLAPRTSRIYFSDHSTSSPDFIPKLIDREEMTRSHLSNKQKLTTPKTSSISLFREEFGQSSRSKKGFFLNLPPNRYRRKREQISKLFDGSDSSDRRYFGEPKLLYHVHESSFYSTSKTDDRFSSRRILPKMSTSQENTKNPFCPVRQIASRVDINVKPKYIIFSDSPERCGVENYTPGKVPEMPTKEEGRFAAPSKPKMKNAKVNTTNEQVLRDSETQCEKEVYVLPPIPSNEFKPTKNKTRKLVETENFFKDCIDEFSVVSLPKVHFEDEVNNQVDVNEANGSCAKYDMQGSEVQIENKINDRKKPRKCASILSLFAEDEKYSENTADKMSRGDKESTDKNVGIEDSTDLKQIERTRNKKQTHMILQTSSDSNLIHMDQENFGIQFETPKIMGTSENKGTRKRSRDILRIESTQVDSVISRPATENCLVQVEAPTDIKKENRLTGLMKDVVNLCNSSFVRSRDCIVELTLYNLIKEIILEHCSHLSEQSRQKVESILANFIKMSKQKAGNDVEIVESAIENLVKEIDTEFPDKLGRNDEESHLDAEYDRRRKSEHKHRRKHSRSKSEHRGHKHKSKHRSHHREADGELREKYRRRDDEKMHNTKRNHNHHCVNKSICDMGRKDSETKFRSVDGKREYLQLVQRLKELEEVTKQLSDVTQKQQITHYLQLEHTDHVPKHNNVYTTSKLDKSRSSSKNRMKYSLTELNKIVKQYQEEPIEVNFFRTEVQNPVVTIPRNYPKLPVTKIVINLSNLKLLTRNCVSLASTSAREPIAITDSTEEKQKLIRKIVSYKLDNGYRSKIKHSSRLIEKVEKNGIRDARSEIVSKNKESFTITFHGKKQRKKHDSKVDQVKQSRPSKDFMRIKMIKKKKTVTSTSDQTASESHCSKRNKEVGDLNDIHQITKEYIEREYKLNSDHLYSSIAKDILGNKCTMGHVLDYRGNLDLAYERMASFRLFRGLTRKE